MLNSESMQDPELVRRTVFVPEGKAFYILGGNEQKFPLSKFRQEDCGYPWLNHDLQGQFVILSKGVYIDDSTSINCILWFLRQGAIIISESPWCIGEDAGYEIADLKKEVTKGSCYLGNVVIGGFSGLGISDRANEWLKSKAVSKENLAIYKKFKESK